MTHARTQHPNAPLTPEGRRRMVECVLECGWTIESDGGAVSGRREDGSQVARPFSRRRAWWADRSIEPAASITEPHASLDLQAGVASPSQASLGCRSNRVRGRYCGVDGAAHLAGRGLRSTRSW